MNPAGHDSARLTLDDIASFDRDGYLIVRNMFSPEEIAEIAAESEGLFARTDLICTENIRCRWQNHVETGACNFDCFDPVADLAPAMGQLARDRRLIDILSTIYDEEACLFKDKIIFKPPGAEGYALHQDYISWPSFPKTFITAIVAIDPTDEDNGATEVFPGGHAQGYLSPADGMYHELPASAVDELTGVKLTLAPGDVAIFGGNMPHRSAANRSRTWRRQLYLSYNARSDGGDCQDRHYEEFHAWLRDRYAEYGRTEVYFR
jgi:ectoine hydroxylase-related dioxygenase (phytanoyl-CoA dioxygenase family)